VASYQAPRGTYDLLPEEAAVRRVIVHQAEQLLGVAGFGQIDTPIFEDTELFARTVGEATDIVRKEMYTFTDRRDRSLTLRPEGTAPVCRAYIEHGMHKLPQPVKLWYTGPMFRYEAPQAGRFRQHAQVGAEVIGSDDPGVDAELIYLLSELYRVLGLKGARLRLTSIGNPETRAAYEDELRSYLLGTHVFDPDQRARIDVNPLRAFDWDGDEVRAVTDEAPKMLDRLDPEDQQHFDELRGLLDAAKIEYELDTRLVRGLDYYTRTVFEFTSDALGAQSGIGGGGRYDRLVEQIGGKATPAAGWATGLERIAQLLGGSVGEWGRVPSFFFVIAEPAARIFAFGLMTALRREVDLDTTIDFGGRSLKGQMKQADRSGASYAVIIGPEEWSREVATIRDMHEKEQQEVPLAQLRDALVDRVK
jgi:histidyl-tRNA synthetase